MALSSSGAGLALCQDLLLVSVSQPDAVVEGPAR
jgi:hypothetical protein